MLGPDGQNDRRIFRAFRLVDRGRLGEDQIFALALTKSLPVTQWELLTLPLTPKKPEMVNRR
jgi:hypothetical protein